MNNRINVVPTKSNPSQPVNDPNYRRWHVRIKPGESFTDTREGVTYVNENQHVSIRMTIIRKNERTA